VRKLISFGGPGLDEHAGLRLIHRRGRAPIEDAVTRGLVEVLIIDARLADDRYRGLELLRSLYDNPRRPRARRSLPPERVLAIIARGDVEAAFEFGRFGIAGVIEEHAIASLAERVARTLATEPRAEPLAAPQRPTLLTASPPGQRPIVSIGYRHGPQTRAGLVRYCEALREHADASTVFEDVATLIEVLDAEGLSCWTNLATKAGVAHSGQFIGSLEFYRQLRRTRYRNIPDHPTAAIAMEVFISIDEVLHEVMHLLFLANRLRAGIVAASPLLAEEFSVGWWQGVVHNRVFPEWIADRYILEINNDFVYCEQKQEAWEFWKHGNVFDQYAEYPWVPYVIGQLPQRDCYIGGRRDMAELIAVIEREPAAAFLRGRVDELRVSVDFESYPPVPPGLRLSAG
jgi:hypothetical protein